MDKVDEKLYDFEYPALALDGRRADQPIRQSSELLPTPYIQLRARLSQACFNHWTILLLLVLFRLVFAARNLDRDLDRGLADVTVLCREVQTAASTAISMPHYLAKGTNTLVGDAITHVVSGLSDLLLNLITAVEALVLFLVDTFKSTYLCLLELAITGSIDVVLDAVETIGNYVNATLVEVANDIQTGVNDANTAIDEVETIIEKAASLLGQKITLAKVSIPQIGELSGLQIPSTFDTELEALKNSINLDAVKNATDQIIEFPFEKLKVLIGDKLSNYSFDSTLLNVPDKESLNFCTDSGLTETFDGFRKAVFYSYHILIVLLVVAAILVIVPHAYLEWWKWVSLNTEASIAARSMKVTGFQDPVDLVLIASHPIENYVGIRFASCFKSTKSKNLARWWISYMTHPPVLLLFVFALAGLLSCALQGVMATALERASPALSNATSDVSVQVYEKISNSSSFWANQTNSQIGSTQSDLNTELFGWIETSTTTVNDTLNTFTNTLVDTLNTTFGGTILYTPILKVLDCIILVRVKGIESGLTWVHDQAHITLPQVPEDALAISADDSDSMFADVGTTTADEVDSTVKTIVHCWRSSIKQEAIIAGALALVWALLALGALFRCVVDSRRRPTRTAFTSCFAKDVKACISRPQPNTIPTSIIIPREATHRSSLSDTSSVTLSLSTVMMGDDLSSAEVERTGDIHARLTSDQFHVVQARDSVHGILG